MQDTIGELWIQTRIQTTLQYVVLYALTLVTRKPQIVCGHSTYRTTALLSKIYIFSVGVGLRKLMTSYPFKYASQSLFHRPFYAGVLRHITWKLQVVHVGECSAYRMTAILSEVFFVCFRVALEIRLERYDPRHASVVFWYHMHCACACIYC